ncbi:MAG: ABC transporter substrate-binding protein [Saccharofermentans sp.]|nr:ABC transporter substrate-binding protein [Saccharofermentans sp.]
MNLIKKISTLALVAAMGLSLIACSTSKAPETDDVTVRIGSLKGPTTIGLVNMINEENSQYEFTMVTEASELAASLNAGTLDIALIPANLAAKLYNTGNADIQVIDINTLGVLYCVSGDSSITCAADLEGRTILTTGQGQTPEYTLRYILEANGVTDYELDFKSEATEIAALLSEDPSQVAVLPQPFVTVACAQNDSLLIVFSLNDEWDAVSDGSMMVTGVTVARREFIENHPIAVNAFIEAHTESVLAANNDIATTAQLVVDQGIVGAVPVATNAIPNCNIVCITGDGIISAINGYLEVLFNQDPTSVGGAIPGDDFYYIAQ